MTAPRSTPDATRRLGDAAGFGATVAVFAAVPVVLVAWVGNPLPHGWTRADLVSAHGLFDLLALVAWAAWAASATSLARAVARRVRTRDVSGASRPFDRIAARIAVVLLGVSSALGASAPGAGASAVRTYPGAAPVHRPRTPRGARSAGDLPGRPAAWRVADGSARAAGGRALAAGDRSSKTAHLGTRGPEAPELALLGIGAIVAALVARRARRARRLQSLVRAEGASSPPPSARTADLAALVAPFEAAPVLERTEMAMCQLRAAALGTDHAPLPAPLWVRAGADGVEVGLAAPPSWSPAGWRRTARPSLLLPARAAAPAATSGVAVGGQDPWCPVLLPLGEDTHGTWLLPLGAGSCLAVVGPSARALFVAMRASATRWAWHEDLAVTDDPSEAAAAAPTALVARGAEQPATRVLFVGDPRRLDPDTRRACAVLTPLPLSRADLTVFVDSRAATVHPFGLAVRPHLMDVTWASALEELDSAGPSGARAGQRASGGAREGGDPRTRTGPARASGEEPAGLRWDDADDADDGALGLGGAASSADEPDEGRAPPGDATRPLVHRPPGAVVLDVRALATTDPTFEETHGVDDREVRSERPAWGEPGPVDVRLLSAVPSIEGLHAPLPPKRARRAVELVAYLAAHGPDPVTGDRLRTRVLGTADTDAAAKTLFNVAGAARRALGAGPDGTPLFPHASRAGHYRLSPLVTLDALRMESMLRAGLSDPDPARAARLLREGLALVRGEPLGGVLTGYGWWRAEGHERRVADAVVDGACALVRAAIREDRLDLARWAVDRARAVEQYSEALSRVAMELAAAHGDVRRLHAEWLECRRQVDEVDPGGSPSEPTERLYARLRAQLSSDAHAVRGGGCDVTGVLV